MLSEFVILMMNLQSSGLKFRVRRRGFSLGGSERSECFHLKMKTYFLFWHALVEFWVRW